MADTQTKVASHAKLVNVLTDEFNLTLFDLKRTYRNIMWGDSVTEEFLSELGFAVIQPKPAEGEGDFVETIPVNVDGIYYQAWEPRQVNPGEAESRLFNTQQQAKEQVKNLYDVALARGVSFNFGTEEAPDVKHIQIRVDDRTNILGLTKKAEREPELVQYFRPYENTMTPVTAAQVIAISDAAYDGFVAMTGAVWAFNDAVDNALRVEDIPAQPTGLEDFYTNFAQLAWVQ